MQAEMPPTPPHLTPFSPLLSTGIAVDKSGLIYFVDGTTIRKVDQNGIVSTFLGSNDLTSARPLTCDNSMDINQVIYTATVRRSLILYVRSHGARWRAAFWPRPRSRDSPFDMRACITAFIFTSCYPLLSSHE